MYEFKRFGVVIKNETLCPLTERETYTHEMNTWCKRGRGPNSIKWNRFLWHIWLNLFPNWNCMPFLCYEFKSYNYTFGMT